MKKINQLVKNRKAIYALAALAAGILCAVAILFIVFANIDSISGFFKGVTRVLAPVIIGLVLAYIIDPVAKFFENKVFVKVKKESLRRTLSAVIALILVPAVNMALKSRTKWWAWVLTAATVVAVAFLKVSAVWIILAVLASALGIALIREGRRK